METVVCSQGFALGDGRPFSRKRTGKAKGTPTLVLLPGLDGTDVFFRPLLAVLPDWIEPVVVQFPTVGANDYQTLLRFVRLTLADRSSYYVLAWSFAGPLALMLAAAEPNNVRGVILASTFVRPPPPTDFCAVTVGCRPASHLGDPRLQKAPGLALSRSKRPSEAGQDRNVESCGRRHDRLTDQSTTLR